MGKKQPKSVWKWQVIRSTADCLYLAYELDIRSIRINKETMPGLVKLLCKYTGCVNKRMFRGHPSARYIFRFVSAGPGRCKVVLEPVGEIIIICDGKAKKVNPYKAIDFPWALKAIQRITG